VTPYSDAVIDLFAGPGGWSVAAKALGMDELGYDLSPEACATARAAGHRRIEADVAALDLSRVNYTVDGLIASPPCQGFSPAGKGEGRKDAELLLQSIPHLTVENFDEALAWLADKMKDNRSLLALQPLRWALRLRPRWIAWEQVTPVLPIWEACAVVLRAAGYSVATGIVHAEQYGVPQARKRAILVARRDGKEARLPTPTHSPCHRRGPGAVRVTVAEAAVLQSFPPDYPWQGSLSDQYQQVGDAVPPFLAYHILKEISS